MATRRIAPDGITAEPAAATAPARAEHTQGSPRVVTSESLLGGASQLAILHHDQTLYFLRQTRFGKLILTK